MESLADSTLEIGEAIERLACRFSEPLNNRCVKQYCFIKLETVSIANSVTKAE